DTYWTRRNCTATIFLFRCLPQEMAKQKSGACGPTFVTIGRRAAQKHRRFGSRIRPIARASIPPTTRQSSRAPCKPMHSRDSIGYTRKVALPKPHVGRMCDGSFMIFTKRTSHRSQKRRWSESPHCMESRRRFAVVPQMNDNRFETHELGPYWNPCVFG